MASLAVTNLKKLKILLNTSIGIAKDVSSFTEVAHSSMSMSTDFKDVRIS